MSGTIRARVKGGLLEPLEKLDLPEGKEVVLTIIRVSGRPDADAFSALQEDGKDLWMLKP